MTQGSADQTNSPSRSTSDDIKLDLFAFPCGHGDTILLHLSDGTRHKWILVDCYLPVQGGVRERFFRFLRDHDIQRLDVIFQTHPDRDHFHGMPEVLEHFTTDERSVGIYYDCGVDAKLVREWNAEAKKTGTPRSRTTRAEKEYVRLKEGLSRLKRAGKLRWKDIDAERPPAQLRCFSGHVELVPIAPNPEDALSWYEEDIRKVIFSPGARVRTNRMSIVLVLSVCLKDCQFKVLLGADADSGNIDLGLDCWKDYASKQGLLETLDVVKVPHHGSAKSHLPRLPESSNLARNSTAVFSVGRRRVLPDREVLRAYLDKGWKVLATTTRHQSGVPAPEESSRCRRAFTLAGKSRRVPDVWRRHLVRLSWSSNPNGIDGEPPEAAIVHADLPNYETAGD